MVPTNPAQQILVVEDEPAILDVVSTALRHQGHEVTGTRNGQSGLELAIGTPFALVILDVMLPHIDGLEICRKLRARGNPVPVLFLTARDDEKDRIKGFVAGGDDYLTKPFSVDELVLRVAAILRRTTGSSDQFPIMVGDLTLDPASQDVDRAGTRIELSATEYRLLHYLMANAGVVVSKAQILRHVWDDDHEGSDNLVELYISYLRRKLDLPGTSVIRTKRGAGYVLDKDGR